MRWNDIYVTWERYIEKWNDNDDDNDDIVININISNPTVPPDSYETDFYRNLKQLLAKEMPELKRVSLWNNQFVRWSEENSWGFPSLFVQFTPAETQQALHGVQFIEYTVTLHLAVESYLDEDLRIWELKQKLFRTIQYFESNSWTRLERTGERPDFNHDAWQVFEVDFHTMLTDYSADNRPKRGALVLPVLQVEVVEPNELEEEQ